MPAKYINSDFWICIWAFKALKLITASHWLKAIKGSAHIFQVNISPDSDFSKLKWRKKGNWIFTSHVNIEANASLARVGEPPLIAVQICWLMSSLILRKSTDRSQAVLTVSNTPSQPSDSGLLPQHPHYFIIHQSSFFLQQETLSPSRWTKNRLSDCKTGHEQKVCQQKYQVCRKGLEDPNTRIYFWLVPPEPLLCKILLQSAQKCEGKKKSNSCEASRLPGISNCGIIQVPPMSHTEQRYLPRSHNGLMDKLEWGSQPLKPQLAEHISS